MAAGSEDFARASRNPGFVQEFLQEIALPEGASRIIYDPDGKEILAYFSEYHEKGLLHESEFASLKKDVEKTSNLKDTSLSFQTYLPRQLLGTGTCSPIFVSRSAFLNNSTLPFFESALVDHEGQHTKDARDGIMLEGELLDHSNIDSIGRRTEEYIFEVRGYMAQISKAKLHGLQNTPYYHLRWNTFMNLYQSLQFLADFPVSRFDAYAMQVTINYCAMFRIRNAVWA
ncbi:MAG: hypothetical protein HGA85_05285 [Nanoarchaeota archaeon]|nr:hypothetical protein [Nanoarchaeota archaeon]